MKNKQKFEKFLESLKDGKHDSLIESVKQGFRACCESVEVVYSGDQVGGKLTGFEIEVSIDNDLLNKLPKVAEALSRSIAEVKGDIEYYKNQLRRMIGKYSNDAYVNSLEEDTGEDLFEHFSILIEGDCEVIGDWHGEYSSAGPYEEAHYPDWETDDVKYNVVMQIKWEGIGEIPDSLGVVALEDGSPEKIWMDGILDTHIREQVEKNIPIPPPPGRFSTTYSGRI